MAARKRSTPQTKMQNATIAHRRTMDRVLDRSVTSGVKADFNDEMARLEKDLRRALRNRSTIKSTRGEVANVARVVTARMKAFADHAAARMVDTTAETQAEAVRSLAKFLHTVRPSGTKLDDESAYRAILRKDTRSLSAQRRASGKALSKSIVSRMKEVLHTENLEGITSRDLERLTVDTVQQQWWQIDRTIRTENSVSFNQAQYNAFLELGDEARGIFMRWTEMVNDITGLPMDTRVGNDSLVLHGQLAPPGGSFVMPPHPLAPKAMVGKIWYAPPNRPNDRAVLTPWAPGQGVDGWQWLNSRRINIA